MIKKKFGDLFIGDIFLVKSRIGGMKPGIFVKSEQFEAKHILDVQEDETIVNFEPSDGIIVKKEFNMNLEILNIVALTSEFRKVQQLEAKLKATLANRPPHITGLELMADYVSIEVRITCIKTKIKEQMQKEEEEEKLKITKRFDELTVGDRFSVKPTKTTSFPRIYVKSKPFEAIDVIHIEDKKKRVVTFKPDDKVTLEKTCNMNLKSLSLDELAKEYMRLQKLQEDVDAKIATNSPYLDPIDLISDHVSANVRQAYITNLFLNSREINKDIDIENRSEAAKKLISEDFMDILKPLRKSLLSRFNPYQNPPFS